MSSLRQITTLSIISKSLRCEASRNKVIESIVLEAEFLAHELSSVLNECRERIPISPPDIKGISDELNKLDMDSEVIESKVNHLRIIVDDICRMMEHYPEHLYADYAERCVKVYMSSKAWKSAESQLSANLFCLPSSHQAERQQDFLKNLCVELQKVSPFLLTGGEVQMCTLGRLLYHYPRLNKEKEKNELLMCVASYLHLKHTQYGEECTDMSSIIRTQWLADKLPAILFRIRRVEDRFLNGYTLETLKEHLVSLTHSNIELLSERSKSIPKFVLSTIGTLISGGYMDGSRPSEIIKKIDFRRPLESTQRDYISKGWKDVRIIHDFLLDITD